MNFVALIFTIHGLYICGFIILKAMNAGQIRSDKETDFFALTTWLNAEITIARRLPSIRSSCKHTLLTKMSSPSSLSPSAIADSPASVSSAAGKGGGFRSELAAMFPVARTTSPEVEDVGKIKVNSDTWRSLTYMTSDNAFIHSLNHPSVCAATHNPTSLLGQFNVNTSQGTTGAPPEWERK